MYKEIFAPYADKKHVQLPVFPDGVKVNNHNYFVVFDSSENQQLFLSLLREKEIYAYIGYMPLHSSPMGMKFGYKPEDLPITEDLASRVVRLPFYVELQDESLTYCTTGIQAVLQTIYGY